jgi:poly(hydroxyalkanoate) granule-associated protein
MVTKEKKTGSENTTAADLSASLKDSAQQIWLAGLGAFSKAQEEGGKMFDTLVKEGTTLQRKTQTVTQERFADATNRMASIATDLSSKAAGQLDKLEGIFESRVAQALNKLGVPSAHDIALLNARIDELDRKLAGSGARTTAARRRASSTGAAKTTGKTGRSRSR